MGATPTLPRPETRSKGWLDPARLPTPLVDPGARPPRIVPPEDGRFRLRRVGAELLALAAFACWTRLLRRHDPGEFGARVRAAFERLGGVWIKLGQILALRKDLFHLDFCLEVGRLHDRATAFPGAVARRVIEEDLGAPIEAIFSEFQDDPVAAASIGQCHLARLRVSGHRVAVKVQRPEAPGAFRRDLHLIRLLIRPFHWIGAWSHFRWNDFVWELENILNEELDYRSELNSLRSMRRNLRKHKRVYVPRAVGRYCSQRVLTLEYVEGVFMSDVLAMMERDPDRLQTWFQENGVDPPEIARGLYATYLRQLLEDQLFHGDLHPGNILLLRDNWICLIDFGTVTRLETQMVQNLQMVMAYIGSRNYSKALEKFLALADALPAIDMHELRTEMLRVFQAWDRRTRIRDIPYAQKSMVALWADIGQVVMGYRILMDWTFLRVDRATLTVDVSLQQLFPRMNFPKELTRYFRGYYERLARKAKLPTEQTLVRARWASLLSTIPDETPLLLSDLQNLIQKQTRSFKATTTKIAYLLEIVLVQGRTLLFALSLAVAMAWAYQRPEAFPSLQLLEGRLGDFLRSIPALTDFEWLSALGSALWLVHLAGRILRRFRRPEPTGGGRALVV